MKKIIIGFFAFALGIAGAFASALFPSDVYVKAKLSWDPESPFICVNTNIQCEESGYSVCCVEIYTTAFGLITASSTGNYKTYKAGCTLVLNDIGHVGQSDVVVYNVLSE